MRSLIAAVIGTVVSIALLGAAAPTHASSPAPTAAQASVGTDLSVDDACSNKLNKNRRAVYLFKDGRYTLAYGKVTVIANKRFPNHYCVRVNLGSYPASYRFSRSNFAWNGSVRGVFKGGVSMRAHNVSSYRTTLVVPDGQCSRMKFGIRVERHWHGTGPIWRCNAP